jgi:hypothetical protein
MRGEEEIRTMVTALLAVTEHKNRRVSQSARTAAWAASEALRWAAGDDSDYINDIAEVSAA